MALQKQPLSINFARGLDKKTDPFQVPLGSFLSLTNSVFTTTGRLTKRNGFAKRTTLPNAEQTTLTKLNDNLIATGSNLYSFSENTDQWLNKGTVQPIQLSVQSLVRSSTSQVSPDAALSGTLTCLVYVDSGLAYYQISNSATGQQIVSRTALPATAKNPRVFILGAYFIITFMETVLGTPTLRYIPVSIADPTMAGNATTINSDVNSIDAGYDGIVTNNRLYLAWGASASAVKLLFMSRTLGLSTVASVAGSTADLMSITASLADQRIYVSYWASGSMNGYTAGFNYSLIQTMAATQIITATNIREITSVITNSEANVFYENVNVYGFSGGAVSDFVSTVTVTPPGSGTGTGTASSPVVVLRSVGLASKAFIDPNGMTYMLVVYGATDQSPATDNSNESTYFLIDSTGNIYMRMAATNAGGYMASQVLPSVNSVDSFYYIPYLITDFLTTVNKGTNLPSGTPTNAIYTQTGINLAQFSISMTNQYSSEIANALHLTGGQLWEFDSVKAVEHGFQVYPENISHAAPTAGGSIGAGTYYYSFTYEWTDNEGNLHRSAPSIPMLVTVSGSNQQVDLYVPTLRLTYKISPNPVRIVGYRWSVNQQIYYQFTSVTSPVVNDTTVDYVTITDMKSDAQILGQTVLYTTGGVLENIAAPPSSASTLYSNRLVLVDAEDRNLLWYSKQVIQSTPVEMSDLQTIYVAPTTGAQGSTGPVTALSAMDDKLIIYKKDAIYYITGSGPDITGANNTFSDSIFITGTVGCDNPRSIALIPMGLMFQSDKGIWLLGRDLSTKYIGAAVESYNNDVVMSATAIPGTNEVRFILASGITLMYDYFYDQWSTHTNIKAISATLYQGLHTYLNIYGQVYQENVGSYLDGSEPVLLSLTTSWINLAGLQGLERFYFANLLGTYFTPFKLDVNIAYDYNSSAQHNIIVTPDNYSKPYGDEALWGSGPPFGGGPGNVFSARLFPNKQKCQSFQLSIQELYDRSLGAEPGQGLSLSGLALITGVKRGFRTQKASRSFG